MQVERRVAIFTSTTQRRPHPGLDGLMDRVQFTKRPDGLWSAVGEAILLCNVTGSRIVYPA